MGFDIECIIDIHSYPGEYFCPVCRTLVYPNEAFQAQCTHLYCKPCLVHIANGSKACPYDGYLVTESDSKPLAESDKALAEKVGKVKVHCLYFRSGCTWEGTLSDCPSHCSGCSFGNSPVICNRCGIQIVHRQVHDHAQICPGGYDGQQAVIGASGLAKSTTTSTTVAAVANQTVAQSGAPVPQAQNPQNVAATQLPGQNANLQANANAHAPVVASAAMPAPEQWYQQQYQQYYQQYAGYDPYQQQQYYPPQQQQFQQYQQVQGQHQSHVYSQTVVPPQPQAQGQVQPQPHMPLQPPQQTNPAQQPHLQPPAQGQAQPPPQPQIQMMPQAQAQAQLPPQGQAQAQAQANASVQALAPNYQVNPQQQPHPAMRPQTQIPPQALPPPPHGHPSQPPQFPQAVGMRPPAQHPQVPHYQQGQGQMHHPQGSQAHLQPQMHPQVQDYVQSSSQSNAQSQPQAQHYQSQSQLPVYHSQTNQPAASAALSQAPPHPPLPPVSGHHSYQQPQTAQKMQPGAPQQHAGLPHPPSGPIHPVQVYAQVPQQPTPIRPPHAHVSFSQQQPSAPMQLQSQAPGIPLAPHQQFLPHGPQPTHPIQHRPVMQPVQQAPPHNYAAQQQFSAPFQGQLHQQGYLPQQPPMQSQMQMRPPGPPQQQQSQNYLGVPSMPNQGIPPQSHLFSSGGFGASGQSGAAQGDSTQTSINQNQNYANSNVVEQNATVQEIRSPKKVLAEKGFVGNSMKEEVGTGQNGTLAKDTDDSAKDGLVKSVIKQEKGDPVGSMKQANEGKPFEAGGTENETRKAEVRTSSDSVPLKQADPENLKLSKTVGLSSGNLGNESYETISGVPVSSAEGHVLPPRSHGSHQERSQAQVQGQPSSTEGKVPCNLGGPPKSFESQSGLQGSALNTLDEACGSMGKPHPLPFESQYGSQHVVRPMSSDQMSGSGEWRPLTKPHVNEPNLLRMNGAAAPDPTMFGARDENSNPFAREPSRTFDQVSRSLDKPLHGHSYDAVSKLDPGAGGPHSRFLPHHPPGGRGRGDMFGPGPEFGHHHIKPFPYHSPGRDYLGSPSRRFGGPASFPHGSSAFEDINSREAHGFGEGSRSFNLSSDLVRNPFRDGRFPPLPGHLRRGVIDDPGNPRFSEHRAPGLLHNQIGAEDVFGPDGPGHLMKGKFSGPGYLSGHFSMGETAGPGNLPGHGRAGEVMGNFPRPPFSDSVRGDTPSFLRLGEPSMRNNYPYHGMPNAAHFSGGLDLFDQSRKRKPISNGWCRICEFDCETVEGLEMHSQTREHQNMAMDMVKRIKLQNKKQRAPGNHMVHEGGTRTRKVGTVGHGSKS